MPRAIALIRNWGRLRPHSRNEVAQDPKIAVFIVVAKIKNGRQNNLFFFFYQNAQISRNQKLTRICELPYRKIHTLRNACGKVFDYQTLLPKNNGLLESNIFLP